MSKLVDAIEVKQTGKVKAISSNFAISVDEAYKEVMRDIAYEYKVGVHLEVRGYAKNSKELSALKDSCKRSIVEEVFGEFRKNFREIERALYYNNLEEAKLLFANLENEMFN